MFLAQLYWLCPPFKSLENILEAYIEGETEKLLHIFEIDMIYIISTPLINQEIRKMNISLV